MLCCDEVLHDNMFTKTYILVGGMAIDRKVSRDNLTNKFSFKHKVTLKSILPREVNENKHKKKSEM